MKRYREDFVEAADGTRIFWSAHGEGPAVVLLDGIGCAGYVWKYLRPRLAERYRVIHLNYRGHGQSGQPGDPNRVTIFDCVDDLLAVLDAAGVKEAVLLGHSMGCQIALETHRRAPERVSGLGLICGCYGRPLDTFHDGRSLKILFPYVNGIVQRFPAAARRVLSPLVPTELSWQLARLELNQDLIRREDFFPYLTDLAKVDVDLFARMLASAAAHDAYDHLTRIEVPTLIVAGEKDTFTPMWLSIRMHASIKNSEILILPEGSHAGPLEHPELLSVRVEQFLSDRLNGSGSGSKASVG